MQMTLNTATREQLKRTWAFAVDKRGGFRRRRRSLADCVITACSKEARALGIRAGMRYEDAKALIPDIKILVIGKKNV